MCGLLLTPDYFSDGEIHKALDRMYYRGLPTLRGIERQRGLALGHVRLPLQTLPTDPDQPWRTPRGDLIGFVGEIFSARGENLMKEGISEAEVIESCLDSPFLGGFMNLDGFWSIIQIPNDLGRCRARILTDHLGIKPLYYWAEQGIVCSELAPMFSLVPAPRLDEVYLSNCIKFGYDYSGRTPYEGIVQIPPGTVLFIEEFDGYMGSSPLYRYWQWDEVPLSLLGADLRGSLVRATLDRVASSHVPVSLLLSGGLDSSIVYHILERTDLEPELLSIENGESEYLPPGVRMLEPEETPSYTEAVEYMQAPLDLGSLFPQVQLSKALGKNDTHVCLSGDGADELFGGYTRAQSYDSQASDVFCELPYYHLPRLDRVMMANTVELRSPFLSPSVVAHALALPWKERTEKQALKKAFSDLPRKILERPKRPLKSAQVLVDPIGHRAKLVETFRCLN